MDEEFGSFVVTDPDIVDPSIDVSGLRTQTDTSLLGNIPDFAGIQYEAFNPTRLTDLMRLYTTGLPMIDTPAAAVPPATGGGGSGDGGQATLPGFDVDSPKNTPEEQRLIDEGIGVQIGPGDPVVAPGEIPVTQDELDAFNQIPVTQPLTGGVTGDPILMENIGSPDLGSATEPVLNFGEFAEFGPVTMGGAPVVSQQLQNQGPTTIQGPLSKVQVPGVTQADLTQAAIDKERLAGYTPSTSITPEDTEQSITQKVADFLDVDASKINKAAVTGALNLVAGKALDTVIPIATVFNLVTDPFTKSPADTSDTIPTTGVNPFKDIDTGVGEFDTTPTKQLTSTDLPYDTQFEDMADVENIGLSSRADINTTDKFIVPFEGARTVIENPNYIEPGGTILEDDFESLVEPTKPPMTLADDRINRITDDVDLDLFDTTPQDTPTAPIATDRIGTFDADTFDDTVGTRGPQQTTTKETYTSDEAFEIAKDLYDQGKLKTIGQVATMQDELAAGQTTTYETLTGLDPVKQTTDKIDKKTTAPTSVTPLEDDFDFGVDEFSDEEFMVGDTSRAAPTGGDSGADSFFDAVDTAVGGGGGRDRDPDPSPSFDPGQGFVDQGGGGEFGSAPSKPTTGTTKPGTGGGSGGNGGGGGGGKIVCTMMNESYGFGSFRNKIWLRHSKGLAPEYQKGYHKIFLPLVRLSKKNIVLKKVLEHIAVHRTIDIRQESRGKVHLLGRVYRKILEPICYFVGKHG